MKIIDFGLAKLRDATVTLGTTAGTLPYMSPEQTTGADIDHRTDIWSLGTVLYEMLGGRPAFSGDSAAVTYAIAHTDPPRLRDARPDFPVNWIESSTGVWNGSRNAAMQLLPRWHAL